MPKQTKKTEKGRKKRVLPQILEANLSEKNIIQKSNPLFSLWTSNLTLSEFKILDTFLSRIDSRKPECRSVVYDKGKMEALLGVQKINRSSLDERLKHLQSTLVNIGNEDRIDRITLFERAQGEVDKYGNWRVCLTCTPSAMKYIFNIENIGYLKYAIGNITQIKSLYSYILFTYIEYNRFRKTWEIDLNKLKSILNCTAKTYDQYFRFNGLVLKKCHEELTTKTNCQYTYEAIKRGRYVVGIRFMVMTQSDNLDADIQPDYHHGLPKTDSIGQIDVYDVINRDMVNQELWVDPLEGFNFRQEQIDELREVLEVIPIDVLPQSPACQDAPELMRYHYIEIKAKEIKRRDAEKPIRSKFSYLLKILKQDAKQV